MATLIPIWSQLKLGATVQAANPNPHSRLLVKIYVTTSVTVGAKLSDLLALTTVCTRTPSFLI